ncbi:hypothetical protein HBA93_20015 [Ochrobactrum sp. SFR4]|nr:hypothetical protein [Ochrobactrum sp. MR28]MBX8818927.1 hypothetical protein [Ochrobactrum sp. MR31]MBX8827891.1 hypothetical protein [Ochrobactrum sp. SFR4]
MTRKIRLTPIEKYIENENRPKTRQERFLAKKRSEGFFRVTLWVHQDDERSLRKTADDLLKSRQSESGEVQ